MEIESIAVTPDGEALSLGVAAFFDVTFYRARYPDVPGADADLFEHFLSYGLPEGRQPNRYFDPAWYLDNNPDLRSPGMQPVLHYLRHGDMEGRHPGPWFATKWYRDHYAIPADQNALVHYLQHRADGVFSPVPGFDARFYAEYDRDPAERRTDPFEHFLLTGFRMGRNPSATLDLASYAEEHLGGAFDENPFVHYIAHRPIGDAASPASMDTPDAAASDVVGRIDFYGYHKAAGGWLFCGWLPGGERVAPFRAADRWEARIRFEGDEITRPSLVVHFSHGDDPSAGVGVALFAPCSDQFQGPLIAMEVESGSDRFRLLPDATTTPLHAPDLVNRTTPLLANAAQDKSRDEMLALIRRREFNGENTLDQLADPIFLEIDEAILCPPDGLVLIGWWLYEATGVAAIRVRWGSNTTVLNPADCIAIERPDVGAAVGRIGSLTNLNCGFIAFVPDMVAGDGPMYIEIETSRGEIGFRTIPAPQLRGMSALRHLLDRFEVHYDAVRPAFDKVIGPAFLRLNNTRMQERPTVDEVCFGTQPAAPEYSIIVPLHGRIDFIEYQLALIALGGSCRDAEFIYVLDDPPKRAELLSLAESVHLRFGLPLRLLLLSHNMGFAPASNIGLEYARGRLVCFLNSDVFPETPDWLQRLGDCLDAEPDIGAVGPLLLFEDGGVQHEGMTFEPIRQAGNLMFAAHRRQGWRPIAARGLVREEVITGACIVMSRALALDLGGFSEVYAINDFEDTDLCFQIGKRGLVCAVDHRVRLYHLERKSQETAAQRWRRNLTLCNAWLHTKRWFPDEISHSSSR